MVEVFGYNPSTTQLAVEYIWLPATLVNLPPGEPIKGSFFDVVLNWSGRGFWSIVV